MIGGLTVCEVRHEVPSEKKEFVMVYFLGSRDGVRAEEKVALRIQRRDALSDMRQQAELHGLFRHVLSVESFSNFDHGSTTE